MLRKAYEKEGPVLSYVDKLEILSYRIYSYFGHGVIDMLRDNAIDGIGGGQSGLSEDAYDYRDVLQVEEEEKRAREQQRKREQDKIDKKNAQKAKQYMRNIWNG